MTIRRLLVLAAATGSGALAIETAVRYATPIYFIYGGSLYAIAALLFAGSAALLMRDPVRGRLLAVGGAIILASWVVAIGYGGSELATRAIAALGALAAVAALVGSPPWWTALGIGTLLVAGVPLVYLLFVHPPLALIAIYAVAGVGIAAGVLSLLPSAARRWPLLALGSIGLLAWLFGAIALVLVFGPPLGPS